MKTARKRVKDSGRKSGHESKSVSMPRAMLAAVEARVDVLKANDPDLDFSKYVRRLIRRDVEAA